MACCKSVSVIPNSSARVKFIYKKLEDLSNASDISEMTAIQNIIVDELEDHETCDQLLNLNDQRYDKSVLFTAMSIPLKKKSDDEKKIIRSLIQVIISRIPELIVLGRKSLDYKGLTPVHLAIIKSDKHLLNLMKNQKKKIKGNTPILCAEGYALQDTIMMAGTPLGVAALKIRMDVAKQERDLQKEIFEIVLENFATDIFAVNRKGDNILHSLIKYLHVQPHMMSAQQVKDTMKYILKLFPKDAENELFEKKTLSSKDVENTLLTTKNKENLTPLQLATKRQQYEIFEFIMQHETYCFKESSNGLVDEDVYDITDIETLPVEKREKESAQENIMEESKESHLSILQMLKFHDTVHAFRFADFLPVKEVIRTKWKFYRKMFWAWFILHFAFMVLLTASAVYRSKLKEHTPGTNIEYQYAVMSNAFVTTVGAVGVFKGVTYILLELIRFSRNRFKYQVSSSFWRHLWLEFCSPYSNLSFRLWFIVFSLLLIVDFVAAVVSSVQGSSSYENYCLIFAVIVGWYLVMFFIQSFKPFSFFTVLIQQVISDMVKFAVVMTVFLVAFSAAMYMIMQGANTDEDDFDGYFKTCIKMLTIMLGIGELSILFSARQPILAVIVFVLFVLLTTILLLNALLAMMSNTCTGLMTNYGGVVANKMHGRLQKLSVILFLEGFLPRICCHTVGEVEEKYFGKNRTPQLRLLWRQSCVPMYDETQTMKKGDNIYQHHIDLIPRILQHVQNMPVKRKRKNSIATMSPLSHGSFQRQVSRRLDITDAPLAPCNECSKKSPPTRQTHEIEETINEPNIDIISDTMLTKT